MVAFPVSAGGIPRADLFERLLQRGFRRLLAGEEAIDLEGAGSGGGARGGDDMLVLVDRLAAREDTRVAASSTPWRRPSREGGGRAFVRVVGGPELRFSEGFDCARCGRGFEEPQPRLFSFNNPYGACPTCHGFGNLIEVDQDLVIPDKERSLRKGAVEPWNKPHYKAAQAELRRFARRRGVSLDTAWKDLPEEHRRLVLEGDEEFQGVVGLLPLAGDEEVQGPGPRVPEPLSRLPGLPGLPGRAPAAGSAAACSVGGRGIDEVCALSVREALRLPRLAGVRGDGHAPSRPRSSSSSSGASQYLTDVGLDYLTLDRAFASLSGGEAQRIALATALGHRAGGHALRARRAVHRPPPARYGAARSTSSRRCATRATPCWSSSTTAPSSRSPTT